MVYLSSGVNVGGADYGSVRIGAFMGRKIIKSITSVSLSNSSFSANTREQVNELEEDSNELPVYEQKLPESILGETFLETYL
ncbi:hypothetical protein MKX01_001652 [Papaver californicum]|nr:hypothetical protein MKX01_001652 [Papaver californicum]